VEGQSSLRAPHTSVGDEWDPLDSFVGHGPNTCLGVGGSPR
jgi:hypothetical protein